VTSREKCGDLRVLPSKARGNQGRVFKKENIFSLGIKFAV
jgi:hypothetical protein